MSPADFISLGFGGLGLLGAIVGGATWIGQQKAKQQDQDRRIALLEDTISSFNDNHTLVARLDERLAAMERTLKDQPKTIALCVGEAIKAALEVSQRRAA